MEKKRRDTLDSEEMARQINREKDGDSYSKMKRWREKEKKEGCVNRACCPSVYLPLSLSVVCFVDPNNMIKA